MTNTTHTPLHFGVLGKTLGHSLSPDIHADLLKQQSMRGSYEKYELTEADVLNIKHFMQEKNILGLNITIPYKETVCQLVDVLDEHAAQISAVNTLMIKDNLLYGYNTDYIGVVSMFHKAGVSLAKKDIVILGSGGAAKALIYGFHLDGAQSITVAARNVDALQHLKEHFPYIQTCDLSQIPSGNIIINTTPVGMYPHTDASPVDATVISRFQIAGDIVYNPLVTEFLHIAETQGLQIVTGLMMLVDQAIAAEEIWLNTRLDYNMGTYIHDKLAKLF